MPDRKRGQTRRRRAPKGKRNMYQIAKQVVDTQLNKVVETKMSSFGSEDSQLYHNVPFQLVQNAFNTSQGLTDPTANASSNRVGDSILVKAWNLKLWLATKDDRPNQIIRVTLLLRRTNSGGIPTTDPFLVVTGTGNKLLAFPKHEENVVKVLYDKMHTFNLDTAQPTGAALKEAHKFVHIYKKMNTKVTYTNGTSVPKNWTPQVWITAYDSYGTLQTDKLSTAAYSSRIYFQDA